MKTLFLAITLTVFANPSFSQDSAATDEINYFVVLYTTGENWVQGKEFQEQLYSSDHSKHLGELMKTGKVSIGGRYSDTGLLLIKAKDESIAQKLITSDPSIEHGIFKAEIHPFEPFYGRYFE